MACAYCEGWDGNMLPSLISCTVELGLVFLLRTRDVVRKSEKFCLNFDVNTFIERSSFDLKL